LKIGATGADPRTVQRFAAAVGAETKAYVDQLGEAFQLVPLDPPDLPRTPVDTKQNLTIALGAILGIACGIGLGALVDAVRATTKRKENEEHSAARPASPSAEALPASPEEVASAVRLDGSMLDGALVSPRIREDVARATRKGQSFSLGILHFENMNGAVKHGPAADDAPPVVTVDRKGNGSDRHANLSANDLMRFWRSRERGALTLIGEETFAVVLPGVSAAAASRLLADWFAVALIGNHDARPSGPRLQVSIGVREFQADNVTGKHTAVSPGPT
jgi:hypothetical protein